MVGAFLYLSACSFKNRIRRRLRRLREPRYLIGLIVGILYFYFMVFRQGAPPAGRHGRPGYSGLESLLAPMQVFGSVALLVVAALAWVWPGTGTPIAFSRAEVQYLFTAPLTRRQLLHYKLLRSQVGTFFSSAIIALLMRPASLSQGWTFMVGLWLVFAAMRLHLMGVSLSRSSLAQHGHTGLAHQWLPAAVALGAVGAVAAAVYNGWGGIVGATSSPATFFGELQRLGTTGAAGVVLWPFLALVRLPTAGSAAAFAIALPPVLALIVLNYMWVLRSDASFEEAAAEHAEKRARERTAPKAVARGATSTPFQLGLEGPPETAILWKNLILLGRYASRKTLLRLLPLVVALGIASQSSGRIGGIVTVLAVMCLPMAFMLLLMGPQMMRNDLRQDLANLAMLKTWPVSGAAVVRGEVLAPAIVMSVVTGLLIVIGVLFGAESFARIGNAAPSLFDRLSYAAAAVILAPAIILAQTVVLNAVAVVFPAWSALGSSRARGIDAMGQRLLMMAGILLTLALSLLPGAAVAALLVFLVYWMTGTILVVLPALLISGVVLVECWVATELIGRALDRTDVTALDPIE